MNVGPPPLRARSTASRAASHTASTSPPSTRTPGIPYPAALCASASARVCAESGVEIAHWLLLQKRIAGACITPAKFAPSWNAPSLVAPSPKYAIDTVEFVADEELPGARVPAEQRIRRPEEGAPANADRRDEVQPELEVGVGNERHGDVPCVRVRRAVGDEGER